MQANLVLQFDFRDTLQGLPKYLRFEFKLALVRNVLVMTAAALLEIWAIGLDAVLGCFDYPCDGSA